jgi:ribonuclease BN (tRNA processing enzyme)
MTKLLFLGSGSAFTVGADNFQSNIFVIKETGEKLLIDCGSDIRFSLYEAGFSYQDLTDIYISHLHADHVGGLEYAGITTLFDPQCSTPNLYLSQELASELWETSLSGGMKSLQGKIATLDSYFNVHCIPNKGYFDWENIRFELIRVIHVNNGFYLMPSYGLFFEVDGVKIFLTTDSQLCFDLHFDYYQKADLIFQDCETASYPTTVHAHYSELVDLPSDIKKKMWLYGYQPTSLPDAQKDGFLGFVIKGQSFDLNIILKNKY